MSNPGTALLPGCNASHSTDTRSGYVVRATYFSDKPHEDVNTYEGGESYLRALSLAKTLREFNENGYAVVDSLYACGCRIAG